MEFMIWLTSAAAPWIGVLSLAVFALIPAVYFFSSARPMMKRVRVTCPETGGALKIRLGINLFRDPRKIGKGLDVVGCPHFSGEEVTCSKGCLLTCRVQQLHRIAGQRHAQKPVLAAIQ